MPTIARQQSGRSAEPWALESEAERWREARTCIAVTVRMWSRAAWSGETRACPASPGGFRGIFDCSQTPSVHRNQFSGGPTPSPGHTQVTRHTDTGLHAATYTASLCRARHNNAQCEREWRFAARASGTGHNLALAAPTTQLRSVWGGTATPIERGEKECQRK
jgi:hypothetical protein